MNPYSSYKESGVKWIGEIPSSWSNSKLKYISHLFTGDSLNEDQKSFYESDNSDEIPYVSSKDIDVNFHTVNYDNGLRIPPENNPLKIGPKGCFLLCVEGGSSGRKMCFLDRDVCFVNKLCCFHSEQNTKFQYYFVQSSNFQSKFRLSLTGIIGGVSISTLKNFEIPLPPLQEQRQISNYLDHKTQKINSLTEKTQQKIVLLKEQRISLINHVVTKGLNPDVEMKDSGVEWIGKIPSEWNSVSLRPLVTKVGSGSTPRGGSENYPDQGITFLRSQNVHFDGLRLDNVVFISPETHNQMSGSSVQRDDLLLNITGGSIGRCCVVDSDLEMNVNQHVSIIRTTLKLTPDFLNYVLSSDIGQEQVIYNQTGGNREGLTSDNIKNFNIGLPSIEEQQQIIDHLDQETTKIDSTIEKETQRIDLLKEYRQSLISEVVTGKVDVRDEVVV